MPSALKTKWRQHHGIEYEDREIYSKVETVGTAERFTTEPFTTERNRAFVKETTLNPFIMPSLRDSIKQIQANHGLTSMALESHAFGIKNEIAPPS